LIGAAMIGRPEGNGGEAMQRDGNHSDSDVIPMRPLGKTGLKVSAIGFQLMS
jgi:hypothetical protein